MAEWAENLKRKFASGSLSPFEPVDSILWKYNLAAFYKDESLVILRNAPSLLSGCEISEHNRAAHDQDILRLEAHVVGLAQALHSIRDIFLQLVNRCLLSGALHERDVNWEKVRKHLEQRSGSTQTLSKLHNIQDSKQFHYLDGLVNSLKHRRAIRGGRLYLGSHGSGSLNYLGCFLEQFEYRDKQHPLKEVKLFINSDYASLMKKYNSIGDSIEKEA